MNDGERPVIHWTKPMLERFEREYQRAVDTRLDVFTFDGHEMHTGYAKYLIEHLKTEFQRKGM